MAFKPRLNDTGMLNNPYWYSENPFYVAHPEGSEEYLGLPNCTCYAWGRFWEISGKANKPTLPLGNAEKWFTTVDRNKYKVGTTPKLGAVICFADGPFSGDGHVAVVEEIAADGTITFSNSGYKYKYFYIVKGKKENNYGYDSGYIFQGFIYNPYVKTRPDIPKNFYPVTNEEPKKMNNNALILWDYFNRKGWTNEAIAGLFGNIYVESKFGPDQGEYDGGGGYGLTQWTPPTGLKKWASSAGLDYKDGHTQMKYIQREMEGLEEQYYPVENYPISSKAFMKSKQSPEYLASAFLYNYERPSVLAESTRKEQARKWYNQILKWDSGETPKPPDPPPTPVVKKSKMIFYMRPIRLR